MTREFSGFDRVCHRSGRGLGRVMAERLAELGANVAIHDLDWNQPAQYGEFKDLGDRRRGSGGTARGSTAVTGNIGDREAVAEMKRKIEADLGDVHILVNCAGGDIGAKGGKPSPTTRSISTSTTSRS